MRALAADALRGTYNTVKTRSVNYIKSGSTKVLKSDLFHLARYATSFTLVRGLLEYGSEVSKCSRCSYIDVVSYIKWIKMVIEKNAGEFAAARNARKSFIVRWPSCEAG